MNVNELLIELQKLQQKGKGKAEVKLTDDSAGREYDIGGIYVNQSNNSVEISTH